MKLFKIKHYYIIGGIELLLLKIKDKAMETNTAEVRMKCIFKAAETSEYPRYLCSWYYLRTGKKLSLMEPKSFNEKIQWLKIFDSTSTKTRLSDKYYVRDYIKGEIGEKYLVPLYGVWKTFDEIDFDQLPNRFVLKCNHGSGTNAIVKSKSLLDYTNLKEKFTDWLSMNYAFENGFELQYKDIEPCIIAEQYLESECGGEPFDYKVHVFNGKARIIQVDIDRHQNHKRNIYSLDWTFIPCSIDYPNAPEIIIERPECLDELIKLSQKLGEGFIYVRCDFYIVGNKIYFGELTFTHGSGIETFNPDSFNIEMGGWMKLPIKACSNCSGLF